MERKILGLDLGVASIGWAVVAEEESKRAILGMGSRIIPLSKDDNDEFQSGNKISKNRNRTLKRTQRKGYDRYQLRREALKRELLKHEMYDENLFKLNSQELWGLRAKAVTAQISLKELGRVLYHLNQKRGYNGGYIDSDNDKKDTDGYVAEVKNRHQELKDEGLTLGQHFYQELQKNKYYRIKQQVFPREAYIEEFEAICKRQQGYYPETVTPTLVARLRDRIVFYQRKLKSQKGLVSICDFEGFWTRTAEGKDLFVGPRVAPRSSPLFQVCKIWESINNLTLRNKRGELLAISPEKKKEIFDYLDSNERLSQPKLFEILGLKKDDGWYGNKYIAKGLQGNITKVELLKHLNGDSPLLSFNLKIDEKPEDAYLVDRKTGQIVGSNKRKIVSANIESQPLYQLWHAIYSIPELDDRVRALIKRFKLKEENALKLAGIDFKKSAFGNKSVKAMRKILPYLIEGFVYSDACSFAGYTHSDALTREENVRRQLRDVIPLLPKNSLRQPVVEKILNQLINLVNTITARYGRPDEIRIELARELKQSREERNEAFLSLSKIERENRTIRKRLQEEYGIRATRNNVIKWRLFHEINDEESKVNAICIYCGKPFGISDALNGSSVDVEHVIPKKLLFDDSQSNKTLSHRSCNAAKGDRTAYDYMESKGKEELDKYVERVNALYKYKIIGKTKRDKLLMPEDRIPKDFIERQMRETQYISRKAKEILEQGCRNVWSTSGTVTAHLRRVWGWDDVLMNLHLPKYREFGLTEFVELENGDGQNRKKEVIKDWSKRDDHRHHAIDALTIACTKQGFIQRLNNLSSQNTRDEMFAEVEKQGKEFRDGISLLDKYLISQKPFTTAEVEEKAAEILISFKAGKKVATIGVRKVKKGKKKEPVQTGIIVPRAALSEESVYGKIKIIERNKPVKYLFENPQLIFKPYIKALVEERIGRFSNDKKKALASLKKEPIYLDKEGTKLLEYGSCFKEEYVIKYPLGAGQRMLFDGKEDEEKALRVIHSIVDKSIAEIIQKRLYDKNKNFVKTNEAFRDLENNPVWYNKERRIAIRSVRCLTGLSVLEAIETTDKRNQVLYEKFIKTGNNHHIAFYKDRSGDKCEHVCTLWHAVERKRYGIPIVIHNPKQIWDKIVMEPVQPADSFLEKLPKPDWTFDMSMQQNEMFVIGMDPQEFERAIRENDRRLLSDYLYVTWSLSEGDYWFRHHLETKNTELKSLAHAREAKRFYRCRNIRALEKLNPQKVRISNLGEIVK